MSITRNRFRSICIGDTIDIIAPIPWIPSWVEHLRHVAGFYWWPTASPRRGGLEKKFDTGEKRYDVLNWV